MVLIPEPQDIGVITPYHAQRCKIGRILTGKLHGIKVGSVEEFQGQVRLDSITSCSHPQMIYLSGTASYRYVHCPEQHGLPEL
jgi:helicase MOV-10